MVRNCGLVILLAGISLIAYSQPEDCSQRLEDARGLFQLGVFEEIPALLEECLDQYETEDKKQAYKLLVLAHYLNDEILVAEETMLAMLKEFPLFEPEVEDPAEFKFVYSNFEVNRLFDVGIHAGSLMTWGLLEEPWYLFDESYNYVPERPGITAGILLNLPLTSMLSVCSQPTLSLYKFMISYDKIPGNLLLPNYKEQHTVVEIPLYLKMDLFNTKIQPYFKVGGMIGFLVASNTESYIEQLNPVNQNLVYETDRIRYKNIDYRTRIHYCPGGGIGMKINFDKYYMFLESEYHITINKMLSEGSNRFDQKSVWTIGYMDSDFRLSRVSVRIGFVKKLYRVRRNL